MNFIRDQIIIRDHFIKSRYRITDSTLKVCVFVVETKELRLWKLN